MHTQNSEKCKEVPIVIKAEKVETKQKVGVINSILQFNYNDLIQAKNSMATLFDDAQIIAVSKKPQDKLYYYQYDKEITHQLIQMVHYAWYYHYPLCFSPDNIQLLISQGFCVHIKENCEKFRNKFVQHQGQQELIVEVDKNQYPNYDWEDMISQFSTQIKTHIGDEKYNLCVHKYSTTDKVAKTCYEVSLMDSMQKYFSYTMMMCCGISKVKLLGTLNDWVQLRQNIEKLREFELDWWLDKIIPVLDQFINLYIGIVDKQFWSDIYRYQKKRDIYDPTPEYATGWITYFFPYRLKKNSQKFIKNDFSNRDEKYIKLKPKQIPSGISQAPVTLKERDSQKQRDIKFNAGYLGVGIDEEGFLYPYQGWAITGGNSNGYRRHFDDY